jgi:hypothetical protein
MGIHSGPVQYIKDANARENISGVGINIARRVMDCGDAGHILVSKRFAGDLAQHRRWQRYLHEIGDVEVKHGVVVSLVNLYAETIGNPAPPACVTGVQHAAPGVKPRKGHSSLTRAILIFVGLIIILTFVLAIVSVIFAPAIVRSIDKNRATSAAAPTATASPSLGDAIQNIVKQRLTEELQKNLPGKSRSPASGVGPSPGSPPSPPPPP